MKESLSFYFEQYVILYTFLVPLGIIGIWRWSVWLFKETVGLHYHPKTKEYNADVSIVTPVYNEDKVVFGAALESWRQNNPSEIIAVIDSSDKYCIKVFKNFQRIYANATLIITDVPGKRPALALGIKKAKSEIVALVDSDTIWDKDVIRYGLPPFQDVKVAGVATYQSVLKPKTLAQKIFDAQLDMRYRHEYPFLAAAGSALVCLSGRTAFYRRSVILPLLSDLVNETFMGKKVISGDDKRLTYLVLEKGYKVAYQANSHVYTPGMKDLRAYLKQRLRWTRNGLRSDLGSILKGWPIHHPALLFFQIDKFLQSFVIILSPIYFFVSIYFKLWLPALIILLWWSLSRTVKMYPHISQKPKNIKIIPAYILYSFFIGVLKIYALFTLNTQGWITRWDKSRLPHLNFINKIPPYIATALVIFFLTLIVFLYKENTFIIPSRQQQALISSALPFALAKGGSSDVLGEDDVKILNLLTKRYEVKNRDSFSEIAKKFGVDKNQLLFANSSKMPNGFLPIGIILTIPPKDMEMSPDIRFLRPTKDTAFSIKYDVATNTLTAFGRGKIITLKDIKNASPDDYLKEVSPKVWELSASLYLNRGLTLKLNSDEVIWLKLKSDDEGFVNLRALDSDLIIDGVKITSWNSKNQGYDENLSDGRSFIMVKDNSRMDIFNSELSYLGFQTNPSLSVSPYGVSWKMSNQRLKKVILTGEVINSKFHHNYFGAYTFGATGMLWKGNEFFKNVRYGLDPHDDSNGFLVENNKAFENGSHGIIFSKRSMYNTIVRNISYNNNLHGIMLHADSNFNIIKNNLVYGNTSGIALWKSSENKVLDNILKENRHGIRVNTSSNSNTIKNNSVLVSSLYGIYLYDNANFNKVEDNVFERNDTALYIKSQNNKISKNFLRNNNIGIYFKDSAEENLVFDNKVSNSTVYGIYTKVRKNLRNSLGTNFLDKNRKNIIGREEDFEETLYSE